MESDSENELERLLREAATEPAHRPEFYQTLLDAEVYILGKTGEGAEQDTLEAGSTVMIQHWEKPDGSQAIPFFSSLEVLQQSIESAQSYIALPARALFEMTRGSTLVLNPRSSYGKEFYPEEINWLLDDDASPPSSQHVVKSETHVILAQPKEYPEKLVESLTKLFLKHKQVSRAYLALMHDTVSEEEPHLIIGIEGEGDITRVIKEAGTVIVDVIPKGDSVDLFRLTSGEEGVTRYMEENTKPFYDRSWATRLTPKGSA